MRRAIIPRLSPSVDREEPGLADMAPRRTTRTRNLGTVHREGDQMECAAANVKAGERTNLNWPLPRPPGPREPPADFIDEDMDMTEAQPGYVFCSPMPPHFRSSSSYFGGLVSSVWNLADDGIGGACNQLVMMGTGHQDDFIHLGGTSSGSIFTGGFPDDDIRYFTTTRTNLFLSGLLLKKVGGRFSHPLSPVYAPTG